VQRLQVEVQRLQRGQPLRAAITLDRQQRMRPRLVESVLECGALGRDGLLRLTSPACKSSNPARSAMSYSVTRACHRFRASADNVAGAFGRPV
jgi:hypothetical protein